MGKLKVFLVISFLFLLFPFKTLSGGNEGSSPEVLTQSSKPLSTSQPEQKIEDDRILNKNERYALGEVINSAFWAIGGGFLGAIIALLLEKNNEAKLDIVALEDANTEGSYPNHPTPGKWKFFRVKIINKPLNKYLGWLFHRQPAQQCSAKIHIKPLSKSLKGRWAGTLELPQASPLDLLRLANFPDPVTINAGSSELLDVFVKYEKDKEAYGWNNEAYLNNWRTPSYKMIPGYYEIEVEITSSNGIYCKKSFKAHIDITIASTYLENIS